MSSSGSVGVALFRDSNLSTAQSTEGLVLMGVCSKWSASENISLVTHKMRLVPLIKIAAIYVPLYLLAGLFLAIPLGARRLMKPTAQ